MADTRMLGKTNQPFCGSKCCGIPSKVKAFKRRNKRRERQEWQKNQRDAENGREHHGC